MGHWATTRLIPLRHGRWIIYPLILLLILPLIRQVYYRFQEMNGFDLSNARIPLTEIEHGGPPRDGIPAIDKPVFVAADKADFLQPDDFVLGIEYNDIRRAYPLRILNHHELVNDRFAELPVLISYCPLCGTGMAFDARIDGEGLQFGVSGLLYNSDMLMYDRDSDSLWSQIAAEAVAGPRAGEKLTPLPVVHLPWQQWQSEFPGSEVLSADTGYWRDYGQSPYDGYEASEDLYFPVSTIDRRYHPKERVIGLTHNGVSRVWPFSELAALDNLPLHDQFGGATVAVHYSSEHRSARIADEAGEWLPATAAYWFAWIAFHPDSEVFQAGTK